MPFGTLAEPRELRIERSENAGKAMEKFVIEGGYPLSGTIVPAGNKNGALPALAAALLTEEEVVIRNVPRIRDVDTMVELLTRLGVEVDWRSENVIALDASRRRRDRGGRGDLDPDPRVLPARRPAAGALRPRRHAPARRRRDRPPAARSAPRRLPRPRRDGRPRPPTTASPRPWGLQRMRLLHGRAVGHGDGERPDGRRAHARVDRDPQRRLRAARPGPRAPAAPDGRAHRGDRLERDDRPRQRASSAAPTSASGPTTSRSGASSPSPPSRAASCASAT